MKLVEVIPTAETDPGVLEGITSFLDFRLGKGVVVARDTPAFIANHLGVFGVVRLLDLLGSGAFTIEEIDTITGPAIGRPKSATFGPSTSPVSTSWPPSRPTWRQDCLVRRIENSLNCRASCIR